MDFSVPCTIDQYSRPGDQYSRPGVDLPSPTFSNLFAKFGFHAFESWLGPWQAERNRWLLTFPTCTHHFEPTL